MNPRAEVMVHTTGVLLPSERPMPAWWCWDRMDPLAVTVVFTAGAGWVEWVLSRQLLAVGLHTPAGEGDVRLEPFVEDLLLTLDNGTHQAMLLLPGTTVAEFLASTYRRVRLGREHSAVSAALAGLLGGEGLR